MLIVSTFHLVRGPIVTRSMEINKRLKTGDKSLPFKEVISCNIVSCYINYVNHLHSVCNCIFRLQGNPQSLEQAPLTYMRDILSLVVNPSLKGRCSFPSDIVSRAEKYMAGIPSVGAYSESQGISVVRDEVAQFLLDRDGFPADPASIFLTNGASDGVRLCMQTIMRDPSSGFKDGCMTPIPQYPLYSALISLLNGQFVPYHLDESNDWSCSTQELTTSLSQAQSQGVTVRALVIINPGNPTGKQ